MQLLRFNTSKEKLVEQNCFINQNAYGLQFELVPSGFFYFLFLFFFMKELVPCGLVGWSLYIVIFPGH
jgi:hypothetical protein